MVSAFEIHLKRYQIVEMRREDTRRYKAGIKNLILASFTEGKEFLHLSLMRVWFRQVANMFGYGLQLNQFTNH
ncbi:MAG: hypothetical protein ACRD8K_01465 [Nitrososphaeraceae archaeon]